MLTSGGDSPWYVALDKPSWTPPSWVFAPVWTVLYALMGVAAWLVGRHGGWRVQRAALTLFVAQLALNFAWSPLFFTAERPGLALVDIVILWVLVALTIRAFGRVGHGAAGWLLVPYLCWGLVRHGAERLDRVGELTPATRRRNASLLTAVAEERHQIPLGIRAAVHRADAVELRFEIPAQA